ncbi:MAG TPA: DUF5677 domain-containing protein [Candidatus Bipolaricaulota bacterium]|nr:DUF5677 domain-containing protein [Candidatus Bipolaricaulota bacterium]
MSEEFTKITIDELIGPPIDISKLDVSSKSALSKAAFDLYRETAMVAVLASHLYESYQPERSALPRDQAIGIGLIVRISKFMSSVLALLCDKEREHGEVIMSLNRCIIESAINLKFFCEEALELDFEEFVKSSLKPEKEAYDSIQKNISKRGSTLPIEKRMLNSINLTFRTSGIKEVSELTSIPKRKNYKDILTIMGMESFYPFFQGIPSHAIHGTWVDLILHHLEKTDDGFRPKPEPTVTDARLLCPINLIILTAIQSYIKKYFIHDSEVFVALVDRISGLLELNNKVDTAHEESISNK